jgi:hypothetical protein
VETPRQARGSENCGDALLVHELSAEDAFSGCHKDDEALDLSAVGLAKTFKVGLNPDGVNKWAGMSDGDIRLYKGQGFRIPGSEDCQRGTLAVLFRVKRETRLVSGGAVAEPGRPAAQPLPGQRYGHTGGAVAQVRGRFCISVRVFCD